MISRWIQRTGMLLLATLCGCGESARKPAPGAATPGMHLVADAVAIRPGQSFTVGVQITLEPGWHTYWRNPGDSGIPIAVRLQLPPGCRAGDMLWPAPRRIEEDGLVTLGYSGEVMLLIPVETTALEPGSELRVRADVDWLICRDVCLPQSAAAELSLPVHVEATPADAAVLARFETARAQIPRPSGEWHFSAGADPEALALSIRPPGGSPRVSEAPAFFPLQRGLIDLTAKPQWNAHESGGTLTLRRQPGIAPDPGPLRGVLIVDSRPLSVEAEWDKRP